MPVLRKGVYNTSAWPHNPTRAALREVALPEAVGEPAPAGATPAGWLPHSAQAFLPAGSLASRQEGSTSQLPARRGGT